MTLKVSTATGTVGCSASSLATAGLYCSIWEVAFRSSECVLRYRRATVAATSWQRAYGLDS